MELTREQKIERILEVTLEQVKKMVAAGATPEEIGLFVKSQNEAIYYIK
jgi:hypothetical protein